MANTRQKRHPAAFKAKVALEAAKLTKTVAELAKAYQVYPVQINQWKKQLLDGAEAIFRDDGEAGEAELYEKIGTLDMEVEFLKKRLFAESVGAKTGNVLGSGSTGGEVRLYTPGDAILGPRFLLRQKVYPSTSSKYAEKPWKSRKNGGFRTHRFCGVG